MPDLSKPKLLDAYQVDPKTYFGFHIQFLTAHKFLRYRPLTNLWHPLWNFWGEKLSFWNNVYCDSKFRIIEKEKFVWINYHVFSVPKMELLVVHDCFWVHSEPGLLSAADEYVQPLVVDETPVWSKQHLERGGAKTSKWRQQIINGSLLLNFMLHASTKNHEIFRVINIEQYHCSNVLQYCYDCLASLNVCTLGNTGVLWPLIAHIEIDQGFFNLFILCWLFLL